MLTDNWGGGLNCTYHYLSVPIREGSCCITADRVLAVSEPASEGVLDLETEAVWFSSCPQHNNNDIACFLNKVCFCYYVTAPVKSVKIKTSTQGVCLLVGWFGKTTTQKLLSRFP